jgi:hypothetical protein
MAGAYFLTLLKQLRSILIHGLQISNVIRCVINAKYPDHFIFKQPVFHSEAFERYASSLLAVHPIADVEPVVKFAQDVVNLLPSVVDGVQSALASITGIMVHNALEMNSKLDTVIYNQEHQSEMLRTMYAKLNALSSPLKDLTNGRVIVEFGRAAASASVSAPFPIIDSAIPYNR